MTNTASKKLTVKGLRTALRAIDATATVSVVEDGGVRVFTLRCDDNDAPAKAGIVADRVDTTGGRFAWRHVFQIVEE